MTAAKMQPYQPQPPLTDLERKYEGMLCRDLDGNHRFGVWAPGHDGARRCNGCDRTAVMMEAGR